VSLSVLGFAAFGVFLALVLTKRLSAVVALILVPVIFGALAGFSPQLGEMMIEGVKAVAPTSLMLIFALLYFAVMIEAGLFEPLVRKVLAVAGDDPVRVSVGSAILAMTVSLDGDGATTALVTISAMYPVYRRLGMNPLILAILLGLSSSVINWLPWGGPAARAATALRVETMDVVGPLLPALGLCLLAILALAYLFGRLERRRLAADRREPLELALLAAQPGFPASALGQRVRAGRHSGEVSRISPDGRQFWLVNERSGAEQLFDTAFWQAKARALPSR